MNMLPVTIVFPTKNRAKIIKQTLPSYLTNNVEKIVVVDDNSCDNTEQVVLDFQKEYPDKIKYLRNSSDLGALRSKRIGAENSSTEFVLFGEDDAFISSDYATILYNFEVKEKCIVSGQIIYLNFDESLSDAQKRFGNGDKKIKEIFDKKKIGVNYDYYIKQHTQVPFTHALFMVNTKCFLTEKTDFFYAKGNGYREESDVQIQIARNEHISIYIEPTAKCYHLNYRDVKSGGQRRSRISIFFWNSRNTVHFVNKNYCYLFNVQRIGKLQVIFSFEFYQLKFLFINPFLRCIKRLSNGKK